MKKTISLLTVIATMTLNAHAANYFTTSQSGQILNGPVPAAAFPNVTPFNINQFVEGGPLEKTLVGVTFNLESFAEANVAVENRSSGPVVYTATLASSVLGQLPSINANIVSNYSEDALFPVNPGEIYDFGPISHSDSVSESLVSGTNLPGDPTLSAFVGAGTVPGIVIDVQSWSGSGGGDAATIVGNSHSIVDWTRRLPLHGDPRAFFIFWFLAFVSWV